MSGERIAISMSFSYVLIELNNWRRYSKFTHIVHNFKLLPGNWSAVVEHERSVRSESGHVAQPNFEEAYLDEYELVVLAQIAKTRYSFRELHNPLHAGGNVGRELLPQPTSLMFHCLRRRRRNFVIIWAIVLKQQKCLGLKGALLACSSFVFARYLYFFPGDRTLY